MTNGLYVLYVPQYFILNTIFSTVSGVDDASLLSLLPLIHVFAYSAADIILLRHSTHDSVYNASLIYRTAPYSCEVWSADFQLGALVAGLVDVQGGMGTAALFYADSGAMHAHHSAHNTPYSQQYARSRRYPITTAA